MYVTMREAVRITGLCAATLRKYADDGKIKSIRKEKGMRLIDVSEFTEVQREAKRKDAPIVCYCRVSSSKQKDDLCRQIAYMRSQFPTAEIIHDIGSGLNFKRKGLQTILGRYLRGDRFTLIVAHRDRLCRFGFELIEFLAKSNGGEIMVLDKAEFSSEQELSADILAILHVFSCRLHGLRKYKDQIVKDLSIEESEDNSETMVRCGEENL